VHVISTDRHTVKPWFAGKIPFTFNLPELQNSDFSLLGGRVTYLDQAPGAHLIYQVRKHRISVLIFQEEPKQERDGNKSRMESSATKNYSFSTETWNQDGLRYFVIGDATADDIHRLAQLLKDAART
jgi:anti-sigma factor RsiW